MPRHLLVHLCLLGCLIAGVCQDSAWAVDPVQAELEKNEAWTGEPVTLIVTLFSPGPFSGTASFDLPELPQTAFLRLGSPVVGSATVDGDSFFTQRHEFQVFTQQVGSVSIPGFRVRFEGKPSFTSDPEPFEGRTKELQFESKRPPGTESLGLVVAATSIEATQSWQPEAAKELRAGAVVERTIERRAEGTTAMMLTPLAGPDVPGVKVYTSEPVVRDQVSRGQSTATREDTIKYQLVRPGHCELPALKFVWWDTSASELREQRLPGMLLSVAAAAPATDLENDSNWGPLLATCLVLLVAIALVGWLCRNQLVHWWMKFRQRRARPDLVAKRQLEHACRSGDAQQAYQAALFFCRYAAAYESASWSEFRQQVNALADKLYSGGSNEQDWRAGELLAAYNGLKRSSSAEQPHRIWNTGLPPLNPNENSGRRFRAEAGFSLIDQR